MMTSATASAQILQRVKALPPLPAAVGRLLRLVNAPDVEFKEIAKTISLDQTLTAQLLRLANSAFYGFPQQIRTVQQATVILGRHSVRNMALSLAIVRLRNHMREDGPLSPEDFWRHSMGVACGARLLSQHQQRVSPDEAFVAGLLHDIGKIVLVEYDPKTYAELLMIAGEGIAPLHVLEKETFDIDHAEVGEVLCHHWNIPDMFAAAVAAHHVGAAQADATTRQTVEIVNVADTVAKIAGIGYSGNPHISATWLSDSGIFGDKINTVFDALQALPDKVAGNEQIFFSGDALFEPEDRWTGSGKIVHVSVDSFDHYALLNLALRGRAYQVVSECGDRVEYVIADESLPASDYHRYRSRGISIRDYSMCRLEQISQEWLNVERVNEWLTESLVSHTPAS